MAWADRFSDRPMFQQEIHSLVKRRFFVEVAAQAERIQGGKCWKRVQVFRFRSPAKAEFVAAPAAVCILDIKKMPEGFLHPGIGSVPHMTKCIGGVNGMAWVDSAPRIYLKTSVLLPGTPYQFSGFFQLRVCGSMPNSSKYITLSNVENGVPLIKRLSGEVQRSAPLSCLWDNINATSDAYCFSTAILFTSFYEILIPDHIKKNTKCR